MECEIESYRHETVLACDVSQARTHHSSSLLFVLAFQTQRQVCVALPDCRELRPRNQVTNHIRLGVLTIFTMTGIRPNPPFHIRLSLRAGDVSNGLTRLGDCLILYPLHISCRQWPQQSKRDDKPGAERSSKTPSWSLRALR